MRTLHEEANAKPRVNNFAKMMCWKVWVGGGGSTEGGGSEVLLRARVLCCVGARLEMSMVQVALNKKTNRVGTATRQSEVLPPCAHG